MVFHSMQRAESNPPDPGFTGWVAFREYPASVDFWSEDSCRQMGLCAYFLPRRRGVSVSTAYSGVALGGVLTMERPSDYS